MINRFGVASQKRIDINLAIFFKLWMYFLLIQTTKSLIYILNEYQIIFSIIIDILYNFEVCVTLI